jgi:hypothetical protein
VKAVDCEPILFTVPRKIGFYRELAKDLYSDCLTDADCCLLSEGWCFVLL